MKQTLLFAVLLTVARISFADPLPGNISQKNIYTDSTDLSVPAAPQLLAEIMKVTGLRSNFELREAHVLNIEASVSHHKRYILYNPAYINWITNLTKDKWAALALLAHEVGHHLNGHTIRKTGSTPALELEADEFAGFILYRLGATLQQSQEVMNYIAKIETSSTHPGRNDRMIAIQTGWSKAAGEETVNIKK